MSKNELMKDAKWTVYRESGLMKQALTHPSCAQMLDGLPHNNQRLEFLGDSVLGLIVAEMLYELYPGEQEGELARRHSALVCGTMLVEVARKMNLGSALILSDSERENDGANNPSNLEDACEALIGALYLEGGLSLARQFIEEHWGDAAQSATEPPKDPKTGLQEWAQARGLPLPEYLVTQSEGPAHAPEFTIEVSLRGHGSATATGSTKRRAERDAAEALLKTLPQS